MFKLIKCNTQPDIVTIHPITSNSNYNKFGTASLIRTEFEHMNVRCDTEDRAIILYIEDMTIGNLYGHSRTDSSTRSKREVFYGDTLPNLMVNSRNNG